MKPRRIVLLGDRSEAAKWAGYATNRLQSVRRLHGKPFVDVSKPSPGITVTVSLQAAVDRIEIRAEGGSFEGAFACVPAAEESYSGWGDPFTDAQGEPINPPYGTEGGDFRDSIVYKKKSATWKNERYPSYSQFYSEEGIEYGEVDWIGPNGECLTWHGWPQRHPGYLPTVSPILQYSDYGQSPTVGQVYKDNTVFRVIEATEYDYLYATVVLPDIYRDGKRIANLEPYVVLGASMRTTENPDGTETTWLQAVVGSLESYTGIWKEYFFICEYDDSTTMTEVDGVFTEITDYTSTKDLLTAYTVERPQLNMSHWFFNESGTQARTCEKASLEYAGQSGTGPVFYYHPLYHVLDIADNNSVTISTTDLFNASETQVHSFFIDLLWQTTGQLSDGYLPIAVDFRGDTPIELHAKTTDFKFERQEDSVSAGADERIYTKYGLYRYNIRYESTDGAIKSLATEFFHEERANWTGINTLDYKEVEENKTVTHPVFIDLRAGIITTVYDEHFKFFARVESQDETGETPPTGVKMDIGATRNRTTEPLFSYTNTVVWSYAADSLPPLSETESLYDSGSHEVPWVRTAEVMAGMNIGAAAYRKGKSSHFLLSFLPSTYFPHSASTSSVMWSDASDKVDVRAVNFLRTYGAAPKTHNVDRIMSFVTEEGVQRYTEPRLMPIGLLPNRVRKRKT